MTQKDEELMRESIFDYYNRQIVFSDNVDIEIDGYKCGVDIANKRIILLGYLKERKRSPIVVPNIFDEIGKNVLQYCYKLYGIKFGDRVEIIHEMAFSNLNYIEDIDLRDCHKLAYIGDLAFSYTDLNMEFNVDNLLKIDRHAFKSDRTKLININANDLMFKDLTLIQSNDIIYNGHIRYSNQAKRLLNGWFTFEKNTWKTRKDYNCNRIYFMKGIHNGRQKR